MEHLKISCSSFSSNHKVRFANPSLSLTGRCDRLSVFPVQLAHAHLLAAQPDNTCADFDQILSSSQSKSGMSLYGMVAECWNAEQKMTVPAVSGRTYCLRHCNLGEHSEQKRKQGCCS